MEAFAALMPVPRDGAPSETLRVSEGWRSSAVARRQRRDVEPSEAQVPAAAREIEEGRAERVQNRTGADRIANQSQRFVVGGPAHPAMFAMSTVGKTFSRGPGPATTRLPQRALRVGVRGLDHHVHGRKSGMTW
jgi:hypothetical protein